MNLDMHITDTPVAENKDIKPEIKKEEIKRIEAPKKKKKWLLYTLLSILFIIIGGGVVIFFKGAEIAKGLGLDLSLDSLIVAEEPELRKDSTGKYTNILIVGIDTRSQGGGLNTDTIILASYNYETNNVVMISIPRDFNVEIGEGSDWYNKINAVYAYTRDENIANDMGELPQTVEAITNLEIQYYAMVNFEAFVEIIDAVGGIDVNVETSFTDSYYPANTGDPEGSVTCGPVGIGCGFWKVVSFEAGVQHMDGETALEYARSRHSAQDGLDYGRARRQQKVLVALKDKVLSNSTLTNPRAIMDIISSVSNNVKASAFTVNDIQAGLNLVKTFNENNGKSYSLVLDPQAGNSEIILSDGSAPRLGLGNYTDINEYVSYVLAYPALYNDDANISVYNVGLGYQEAYTKVQELRTKYPYLNIVYQGTMYSDKDSDYIYSHTADEFSTTVSTLATDLLITNTTQPEYITTNLNGEDVTILLGNTTELIAE